FLLDDRSAPLDEGIAHRLIGAIGGRVHLDLVPGAACNGILVALAAGGGVEERTETGLWREDSLELDAAPVEASPFVAPQPLDRITELQGPRAGSREQESRAGEERGKRMTTHSGACRDDHRQQP